MYLQKYVDEKHILRKKDLIYKIGGNRYVCKVKCRNNHAFWGVECELVCLDILKAYKLKPEYENIKFLDALPRTHIADERLEVYYIHTNNELVTPQELAKLKILGLV